MAHEPTQKIIDHVVDCTKYGVTQEEIAKSIGITVKTLRKHYKEHMKGAALKLGIEVAGMLIQSCKEGSVPAQIFFLKTRMGWRETENMDLTDKVEPITSITYVEEDASKTE